MSDNKLKSIEHHVEIQHHIKVYINVFIGLAILTVLTVAVSYLEVSFIEAFFIAITIATIKGSLVLGFFMHLITEKQAIIWILVATFIAFLILLFIPLISLTDQTMLFDGKLFDKVN
tara:strand:- start:403 stop:753 length:351 start_codon:yes stop_codon:yes gene_type:complete